MTIEDLDRELVELKRLRNVFQRRGTDQERKAIRERIEKNKDMREKVEREAALKRAEAFVSFE